MDDPTLLSWIDKGQNIAALLVAVGVAVEFVLGFIAGPARRRIDQAKDAEMVRLVSNSKTLEKDVADAKAGMSKQQEKTAIAERALLQLRESLKDRTISPAQQKILVTALRGAPSGAVDIWWTASDTDSFGLAMQMVEIFKESGWPAATDRFATGGTGTGFFIAVHDHTNAPAYAVSIQNAYKLIGIDMNGFSKPDIPEGSAQIFIGHKTPAQ